MPRDPRPGAQRRVVVAEVPAARPGDGAGDRCARPGWWSGSARTRARLVHRAAGAEPLTESGRIPDHARGAGPGARRVRAHRRADRGAVRGGAPGGARRRPLLGADRRRRRRARGDPRARAAGAAAQPGEHRRHRGGPRALPGHPAGGGVRHRLPRRDAAARLALRAAPRAGRPAADPPVRLPRHLARLRRRARPPRTWAAPRRLDAGHPAPGQRCSAAAVAGGRQHRHLDGADPARRAW